MKTIKLIAIFAMMTGAGSCFSYNSPAPAHTGVIKEQKEWGIADDSRAVQRTITLSMSDTMRFTPDTIEVKQGETIRLVLQNRVKADDKVRFTLNRIRGAYIVLSLEPVTP